MTAKRFATIKRVLNCRQPDLTVITDEVHKGRNLSAIVRTCDAVGIQKLHCVAPRAGFRTYRGTALGSHKWVEIERHPDIEAGMAHLRQQGFRLLVANASENAVDYRTVDYTRSVALLLGTEKQGVSSAALRNADQEIGIPMMGMVESLNVSVACAVILAEAQRQRQNAGLYDHCRIPQNEYGDILFRWCQPGISRYCDERGLEYPELDEEGDLRDPSGWYQRVRQP